MYLAIVAIAASETQTQLRSPDVPRIVETVLEAAIPKERKVGGHAAGALGNRTLILDTASTTQAFRRISAQVSPDYRDVRRLFVSRTRDEAIRCDNATAPRCRVVDDGVYTSVTTIQPDTTTGGYRVMLLALRGGGAIGLQGYEQELFVVKREGEWRVDRFGTVRVIN